MSLHGNHNELPMFLHGGGGDGGKNFPWWLIAMFSVSILLVVAWIQAGMWATDLQEKMHGQ